MNRNPQITAFFDKLAAANVQHRCNWQAKRDPDLKGYDVEHLSFVGDNFRPSEATAVLISYGPKGGFGLYFDCAANGIDECVAAIAKPYVPPYGDHRRDTVDALTQAESFIAGFEGDETQEGIADILAGLRGAIPREHVEWVKPGITARVRHLRGEAKLRHASVQDLREQD